VRGNVKFIVTPTPVLVKRAIAAHARIYVTSTVLPRIELSFFWSALTGQYCETSS
jgi:hypothetical protein